MKVTISDVARLAGVSTATVSHTINSTRYVSGETKEKVYRAIAELGYTPDASARSFRTGKKKTIGFIVPDISNKFFATMIESVENYLSAHGYHLIIANTKENPEREETNIRLLSAGLVDGLLIASTMEDFSRFESLIPAGFPVVLVDRTFDTKRFPSVSVSNFQPIYRSVCRLAGKGAWRVHGGGFAGTVQAFVPVEMLDEFKAGMEAILGEGRCHVLSIRQAGGVRLCIVSNSRKLHRVPVFSEKYGVPCVMRAKKPFLRGIREAMTRFGASRAQTALVGDQTYTDVLGANLAGIMSIQVRSICNHTIWLKLRHLLELPPLAFAKNRRIHHDKS